MRAQRAPQVRGHLAAKRELLQLSAQPAAAERGGLRGGGGTRQLGPTAATQERGRPRDGADDLPKYPGNGGAGQASTKRHSGRREHSDRG